MADDKINGDMEHKKLSQTISAATSISIANGSNEADALQIDPLQVVEDDLLQLLDEIRQATITIYDFEGPEWNINVQDRLAGVVENLEKIRKDAGQITQVIPEDILRRVEDGGNPSYLTRKFVESIVRANQRVNGNMKAMEAFQLNLAEAIKISYPDLMPEVEHVLDVTRPENPNEITLMKTVD